MKPAVLPILAALVVSSPAAAYDVVVLQSFESPVYAKAIEGYSETCGGNVKTYTLGKDKKIAAADLDEIKKSKPAAILAVGQSALNEILEKKPPVPVIFTAVSEKPTSTTPAAGILMTVPMERQLEMLVKLAPSVKVIGVVFNPDKSKTFVDDLTRAAKARGIDVKSVTATTPQDAVKQVNALMPTVGAYVFAPDTSIHTPTLEKAAVGSSIKHKVPIIGFKGSQCEQGALLASEMDPLEMGKQAGEVTKMIVADKKSPSPLYAPIKKYKQFVNPKVAEQLGLKMPGDLGASVQHCAEGG